MILAHTVATWQPGVAAGAAIIVAVAAAWLASRLMSSAERRLSSGTSPLALDAAARTRLRLVRRLTFAAIVGCGLLLALLQFDAFDKLAGAVLASSAVAGAIAGLAARQSLANMIAGLTLALTQPIRVGDLVQVGEIRGNVDDLTLTFTWLRTPGGHRVALPNELLMSQPLRNDTLDAGSVTATAHVWIAPDGDESAALAALRALDGVQEAALDEVTPDGVRVRLTRPPGPFAAGAEEELRERALAALRQAGVPRPSGR